MGFNVCSFVRSVARTAPERVALVERTGTRREITYGELDTRVRAAAHVLRARGIAEGDRVALLGENGAELVFALFGVFAAGAVVVPLPPMSTGPEIAARARHARCRAVIADAAYADRVTSAVPEIACIPLASLAEGPEDAMRPRDLPAEALAMLLYTSGTTGTPRGVMITHASLVAHTTSIVHHVLALAPADVIAACLPLSHSFGLRMTLLAPFSVGARAVIFPRFVAAPAVATAREEHVTWWPMVPTMASAIGRLDPGHAQLPKLRFATSAGAPLANETRLRAEAVLGAPLRDAYGMTEATFTAIDVPTDEGGIGTVGRPVPGVEVIILSEHGTQAPPHALGEIAVRGQNVAAGYLDDAEATLAAKTAEGFFRSGDLGYLDAQGRLVVVDRIKDVIVRGGFNVVPAEVEAVLVKHEGVLAACVVGMPDLHLGEEIVAVIQTERALTPASLDAFVRAALSPIKVPRRYAFVRSLPLGSSGKVQRRVLRDEVVSGSLALVSVTG